MPKNSSRALFDIFKCSMNAYWTTRAIFFSSPLRVFLIQSTTEGISGCHCIHRILSKKSYLLFLKFIEKAAMYYEGICRDSWVRGLG